MPLTNAHRALRGTARAAAAVAVTLALLASMPAAAAARPTAVAGPTTVTGSGDVQVVRARLLAAVEPCSTRVPRNDVSALGRCAQDLAVPDPAPSRGVIDLIYTFLYCLHLQWAGGTWDGPYPTVGDCMQVHGY